MQDRFSRLNRSNQQKIKKQIIFFTVAIIILLFVATQFGPAVLDKVSGFTSRFRSSQSINTKTDHTTLEAPFINSIPDATDSATITISGTSTYSDAQVELYVNGNLYDTSALSSNQTFSFDGVKLTQGSNIVKARVKQGSDTSDFTRDYNVVYSQGDPKLDVSSPTDGQNFGRGDQSINVQGQTDPNNTVTVNSSRAIVDENGNFSYYMNLSEGDNTITIDAMSDAGKKTEKVLKVSYHP